MRSSYTCDVANLWRPHLTHLQNLEQFRSGSQHEARTAGLVLLIIRLRSTSIPDYLHAAGLYDYTIANELSVRSLSAGASEAGCGEFHTPAWNDQMRSFRHRASSDEKAEHNRKNHYSAAQLVSSRSSVGASQCALGVHKLLPPKRVVGCSSFCVWRQCTAKYQPKHIDLSTTVCF